VRVLIQDNPIRKICREEGPWGDGLSKGRGKAKGGKGLLVYLGGNLGATEKERPDWNISNRREEKHWSLFDDLLATEKGALRCGRGL